MYISLSIPKRRTISTHKYLAVFYQNSMKCVRCALSLRGHDAFNYAHACNRGGARLRDHVRRSLRRRARQRSWVCVAGGAQVSNIYMLCGFTQSHTVGRCVCVVLCSECVNFVWLRAHTTAVNYRTSGTWLSIPPRMQAKASIDDAAVCRLSVKWKYLLLQWL